MIKSNVSGLEGEISKAYEGIVLLTDPNGIIFISNREDWLFGSLRELSLKDKERIRESQQFGQGSVGLDRAQDPRRQRSRE